MADITGQLQAAAGNSAGVGGAGAYIEDVFSTYLYTGNASTQTITNGIDLAGEGGMVWIKSRSAATDHFLFDTERGATNEINSNTGTAQASLANSLTAFNSDGFTIGGATGIGVNAATYASWTFRKAPKFFDAVTWVGDGTNPRQIAHNLGSVPGCIIVKSTSRAENWTVYHTSLGNTGRVAFNTTDAAVTGTGVWASTSPTDTHFTVSADNLVNFSGAGYVAYLFAHNDGGFGDAGDENVISCGSYTGTGVDNNTVTLGYEPQWILIRRTNTTGGWVMVDSTRGIATDGVDPYLQANEADAESSGTDLVDLTATGFALQGAGNYWNASGSTYIYIAIRRGPMKTPTSGTEVFAPLLATYGAIINVGFPPDTVWQHDQAADRPTEGSRLRGKRSSLNLGTTNAEFVAGSDLWFWDRDTNYFEQEYASSPIAWLFRRAPGFFDVVCYTGDAVSGRAIPHNLGVVPEMIITSRRTTSTLWFTYVEAIGNTKYLRLHDTPAEITLSSAWNNTSPTVDNFTVGNNSFINGSGQTYVAYLFATLAGVSKVGSYTGTGTTQQIDCGFSTGARFVMIKRTDSTGNWYIFNSYSGIVAGNDPYVYTTYTNFITTNDYIDPYSAGFELTSTAPAELNASGGTYIFLAIA